ncbi:probable carboxylesterase 11 [Arachis stenosperma]|uniref:probable carboxylesterase 11 n=1 Tax=Arachis stenosperma TaxID=217475 RepID=UPI0025ABD452|nr:probable carboxylesterase 11 [Arachis stenosperma]XP_057723005.1 probable carboxylesterase 11 [Arachis stenosperma]XP_057723007.1 probable carboxylesterase 11 [Arachis stenosperma]
MPSVAVKLYSVFFKFLLKHRLQNRIQAPPEHSDAFGVTTRPEESVAAANPSFTNGVATKDIHIDPFTSLSIRIFLPESALTPPEPRSNPNHNNAARKPRSDHGSASTRDSNSLPSRRNSYEPSTVMHREESMRRNSAGNGVVEGLNLMSNGVYRGYSPAGDNRRKLPVMLQFHGGGWVSGSNDSVANDMFCRRIAKLCDVIVVAVGYRLAPENRYPAAFEDGMKVMTWLAKQANLAECSKSMGVGKVGSGGGIGGVGGGVGGIEFKKPDAHRHIVDSFGASIVEPWLAAHGDPSRCILLGASCGANIADYVTRKAVEGGKLLDPVKVVAQVLLYPFFVGSVPTHSEIKLANSYFYDKPMCMLAWKLFLPEEEFGLDHPAANPLISGRGPPLKLMPPTLTVVAEHDWMRDRAIAYSEELRKVNVDAPVLEYKDAVHEFATLDVLIKSPQAQVCAEDIAIWVKKYISRRGHEFSY